MNLFVVAGFLFGVAIVLTVIYIVSGSHKGGHHG